MEKSKSDPSIASFEAYTSSVIGDIMKYMIRGNMTTKEEEKSKSNEDSDKEECSDKEEGIDEVGYDYERESDDSYDYGREGRRHRKAREESNGVEMTAFLEEANHYLSHMKQDSNKEEDQERLQWLAEVEGKTTLKEMRETACSAREMMFKSMAMILRAIQAREETMIRRDMIEWMVRMRESITAQPDLGYWKKQFKGEQLELAMNRCWEIYKVETLDRREKLRELMWRIFQDYAL